MVKVYCEYLSYHKTTTKETLRFSGKNVHDILFSYAWRKTASAEGETFFRLSPIRFGWLGALERVVEWTGKHTEGWGARKSQATHNVHAILHSNTNIQAALWCSLGTILAACTFVYSPFSNVLFILQRSHTFCLTYEHTIVGIRNSVDSANSTSIGLVRPRISLLLLLPLLLLLFGRTHRLTQKGNCYHKSCRWTSTRKHCYWILA